MGLCARCLGVLIGQLASVFLVVFLPVLGFCLAPILLIPMAMDWFFQQYLFVPSTNPRRLCTGLLGGLGTGFLQIQAILFCTKGLLALIS